MFHYPKVKVKCQIIYFLVNASSLTQLQTLQVHRSHDIKGSEQCFV